MQLRELKLTNFRNYASQNLELSSQVNVFCGENGQGKTNALEAILMLAVGKSHRTNRDKDVIRWSEDETVIQGHIESLHGERNLRLQLGKTGRKASVNRVQQTKMTDFIGHFQVVLFAPEDLQLVKGAPKDRRRFIDVELGQTQPMYLHHLSQYGRALVQRNRLLKSGIADEMLLGTFDQQLANHGANMIKRRLRFLHDLRHYASAIYADISDGREVFSFDYGASVSGVKDELAVEELEQLFLHDLATHRTQDFRMGYTTVGPHRDDLQFYLNGQDVQSFASQGQQRTIALSLRLAEIDFIFQEVGEYPVLLLDDVLSELDDKRQRKLILSMSEKVQTVITTTSLFHLEDELAARAQLFNVASGIISNDNV